MLRRTVGENLHLETVLAGGLWRTHADPSQLEGQGGLELSLLVLEGSNSQRTRAGPQQAGLGRRSSKWIVGDWSLLQSK
jgi:hypothetical protein